jgi:hypothetical protein
LQGFEDAAVITTVLHVAIPWGVQLGAVDACLEAREEEVVAHQVDHVHVVRLHVAPKGVTVDAQPLMYSFVSRHTNARQMCLVVLLMTLVKK